MGDLSKFKWYSFPRVIVKSYSKESEGNIFVESVVRFTLEVRDGVNLWEVTKRYSEFEDLHKEIKLNYTNTIPIPEFPEKRNIFDRESYDAFLSRRQINLQSYVNALLRQAASLHSSAVRRFLEPPSRLAKPTCHELFILPTLPAGFNMPVVIKFKTGTTEADQNSPRPLSKSQEIPQESSTKPEKLKLLQSLFSLNKNAKSNDDELDILIDFTMIKEDDPNSISLEQPSPRNFDKSREVFYVAVLVDSIKDKLEFVSKEKLQEHANDQYVHNKEQLMKVSEDLERERGILKDLIRRINSSSYNNLVSYLERVLDLAKRASEWSYSTITKFNGTIPFDIEQFERDGEKLVVDYALASNETDSDVVLKKIQKNAKQLVQLIETSWRSIAKITTDSDSVALRKDKLLNYVNTSIFTVPCE
jgi:hypothetical protein